jgi:hypothetical protein
MCALYSLRGRRGNHSDFAAGQHRFEDLSRIGWRAERRSRADHRMRLVDEQNEVRPLLHLANDVLQSFLEHPAEHRSGDERVHLEADDLRVAESHRYGFRLELDAARESFRDCRLAHTWFTDQHRGIAPLAVAENFEDLPNLAIATEHRRDLVETGEQVQIRRCLLQIRREVETLSQAFLPQFEVATMRFKQRHEEFGSGAVLSQDGRRHAACVFDEGDQQVAGFDALMARASGAIERQTAHEFRCGTDAHLAARA